MKVLKKPEFEDDSYLIEAEQFIMSSDMIDQLAEEDLYLKVKLSKFATLNIDPDEFKPFKEDRPSLRNIDEVDQLVGSIYTYSAQDRNDMTYGAIIKNAKKLLSLRSRRNYIRICNSYKDYVESLETNLDVSCLSNIHYLKDRVNLIFRASDIKNELFEDIITIYKFFIKPVYDKPITLSIYASTSQNVEYINELTEKINGLT